MSEPINAVFIVLRKDFDHHTDRKGRLALPIGVFKSAAAANAAAEAHCEAQAARAPEYGDEPEHDEKDGLYKGGCYTREDRRDHFEVRVKLMKLGDAGKTSAGVVRKRKSEGADEEGVTRAPKTARPSAGSGSVIVID
ncbi:hypothetical protein F5Y04DRAFT_54312 [Hypomontagnella monticulosa]|nr:hypothetical protein F5Y04DRAFT_54312 [Hypomontagnella monticulosa]